MGTGQFEHHDDPVNGAVTGAAVAVHRALGPWPLEPASRACPGHQLAERGPPIHLGVPILRHRPHRRALTTSRIDALASTPAPPPSVPTPSALPRSAPPSPALSAPPH